MHACFLFSHARSLPLSLSLLGWRCDEDCGYHCMHEVTMEDVLHSRPVRQFHGKVHICEPPCILKYTHYIYICTYTSFSPCKWPFVRVLGVQEPASMLFSLFNGAAVAVGYHHFLKHSPIDYHLHGPLQVQLVVSARCLLQYDHNLVTWLCRFLSMHGSGQLYSMQEMSDGQRN